MRPFLRLAEYLAPFPLLADAVVLTGNRGAALATRPFLSRDSLDFSDLTNPVVRGNIIKISESFRVDTLVAHPPSVGRSVPFAPAVRQPDRARETDGAL
jgi:hypothetical protein